MLNETKGTTAVCPFDDDGGSAFLRKVAPESAGKRAQEVTFGAKNKQSVTAFETPASRAVNDTTVTKKNKPTTKFQRNTFVPTSPARSFCTSSTRRRQPKTPEPAHSVEEYLANTQRGREAVASITEGTGAWVGVELQNFAFFGGWWRRQILRLRLPVEIAYAIFVLCKRRSPQ